MGKMGDVFITEWLCCREFGFFSMLDGRGDMRGRGRGRCKGIHGMDILWFDFIALLSAV